MKNGHLHTYLRSNHKYNKQLIYSTTPRRGSPGSMATKKTMPKVRHRVSHILVEAGGPSLGNLSSHLFSRTPARLRTPLSLPGRLLQHLSSTCSLSLPRATQSDASPASAVSGFTAFHRLCLMVQILVAHTTRK